MAKFQLQIIERLSLYHLIGMILQITAPPVRFFPHCVVYRLHDE